MEKETAPEKFIRKDLDFTLNRLPQCVIEFQVTARPTLVKKAKDEALSHVAKGVSLPGFRKGKAPHHLIERNFHKAVEEETKKHLAHIALRECQEEVKIPLVSPEAPVHFNVDTYDLEKGADLKISFEAEPTVPEIDTAGMSIEKIEEPEVSEDKIAHGMRQILLIYAEWKGITDRPAKEGDFVLIDVENIEKDPAEKVMNRSRFEVSKKALAKWMFDMIVGLKAGESKEGVSVVDEGASEEEKKAFKPTKVRLTVQTIEEAVLPELTDEFVQKLGAKDVAAFKEHIEKTLSAQAKAFVVTKEREQVSKALLDKYDFDLPASLIQKETQFRLRGLLYQPKSLEEWKTMSEEERNKAIASLSEDAKRAIRLFYISRRIVRDANITVSKEEIEHDMKHNSDPTAAMGTQPQAPKEEQEALSLSRILLAKAQDHILSQLKS